MKFVLSLMACELCLFGVRDAHAQADTVRETHNTELLPILSYDTDAGFGYGVKVFALNHLGQHESFDLTAFNSTKGERWYRLVFSLPDFERRQATAYPYAIDVWIDYDKWIANGFFGVGNRSRYEDKETYTREPLDISLTMSRGFTPQIVGEVGLRYKTVRNFGFSPTSRLAILQPAMNASRVSYASFRLLVRYDTRNSFVNPSTGILISGEVELAPGLSLNDVQFTRTACWFQHYVQLLFDTFVFAMRAGLQDVSGTNLPVQVLLPVGGNNTLRGAPQDRYLDRVAAVANLELRFPFWWRFGGVAGLDAGKVWSTMSEFDFRRWATSPTVGLRFSMDTFIVRLDVGFGKEATGFYLNFGHMF